MCSTYSRPIFRKRNRRNGADPLLFPYHRIKDVARGPSLMFLTLPAVFQQMPMGQLFAVFFFLSVFFAGITSLINMFEAVVESWQSHFNLNRKLAVLLCSAITLGVGLFLEAEPNVGRWMDFITIGVVPIGAVRNIKEGPRATSSP